MYNDGSSRKLSYTQNLEDYHLWIALADQPSGFYIDVGAGHPVADNVSFWFYLRGWSGIVVEPQARLAAMYRHIRPRDRVVSSVIGRSPGEVDFYEVERLHGLSTTIEDNARAASSLGARYRSVRRPCITLAQLCERHADREIDFLKIDVEGAEADVISGNDFTRFRPKIVVAEAVTPSSSGGQGIAWERSLLDAGYGFALFDGLNRFYVAEEWPEIAARFPRDRAPWDSALHMYEIGRAPKDAHHPDHGLACELAAGFWASLPEFGLEAIAALLLRARLGRSAEVHEIAALARTLDSDGFRGALGRIACGYDGGQVAP